MHDVRIKQSLHHGEPGIAYLQQTLHSPVDSSLSVSSVKQIERQVNHKPLSSRSKVVSVQIRFTVTNGEFVFIK